MSAKHCAHAGGVGVKRFAVAIPIMSAKQNRLVSGQNQAVSKYRNLDSLRSRCHGVDLLRIQRSNADEHHPE